jgi:hypothetical protein
MHTWFSMLDAGYSGLAVQWRARFVQVCARFAQLQCKVCARSCNENARFCNSLWAERAVNTAFSILRACFYKSVRYVQGIVISCFRLHFGR